MLGDTMTKLGYTFPINFNFHDSCKNSYIWIFRLIFLFVKIKHYVFLLIHIQMVQRKLYAN